MFFAAFVVGVMRATECLDDRLFGNGSDAAFVRAQWIQRRRQSGECHASVATGGVCDSFQQLI